ncbi:MAG TPA: GNAT family N-acyltransferase [Polyangiales bacterium]|nr:GNAT family N-acyltransferase [Polyangiales bacterium]
MSLETTAVGPQNRVSDRYPIEPWAIPELDLRSGPYRARFARNRTDVEAAQRLRFQVFNLELGEGLQASYSTGRDEDQYDERCHHLLVEHEGSGQIVGTYRLMTGQMAGSAGFYSEGEFHLETVPSWIVTEGVELGRACVASDHRTGRVIYLLWKGIAQYLRYNRLRYLFGCCSVPATDPGVGSKLHLQLARQGHLMDGFISRATRTCSCTGASPVAEDVEIPPLFKVYLDMGAKVCSEPAIDREFGVIDFLIVLDVEALDARTRKRMFGSAATPTGEVEQVAKDAPVRAEYRH